MEGIGGCAPEVRCRCEPLIEVLIKTDRSRAGKTSGTAFLEFCVQIGLRLAERTANRFIMILPRSGFRLAAEGTRAK
jgi:hypothetical protein